MCVPGKESSNFRGQGPEQLSQGKVLGEDYARQKERAFQMLSGRIELENECGFLPTWCPKGRGELDGLGRGKTACVCLFNHVGSLDLFFLDVRINYWTIYISKNCLVSYMNGKWIVKGFRGRREVVREMKQSFHH